MQIAYDARSLQDGGTGDSTYMRELVGASARLYPEEKYLLYANAPAQTRSELAEKFSNVEDFVLPYKIGALWNQKALVPHLQKNGVGVLHAQYLLPRRFRGASIVTIHDVSFREHPEWFPPRPRFVMNLLIPMAARSADVIITGSEYSRQAIARTCGVSPEKIIVTLYAASAWARPASALERAGVLQKYSLQTPFLLGVGLRGARKNAEVVLRALKTLRALFPDLRLVLSGSPEQFTEEIRTDPTAQFLGWVPTEDLPALYGAAAAAVYPSIYEGFGLPVLEAMACGSPMICSNATSIPEVAGDAALQLEPHDVEGWTDAISRVLTNNALRKSMIESGLQRATEFSWEKTARQTHEIYGRFG